MSTAAKIKAALYASWVVNLVISAAVAALGLLPEMPLVLRLYFDFFLLTGALFLIGVIAWLAYKEALSMFKEEA